MHKVEGFRPPSHFRACFQRWTSRSFHFGSPLYQSPGHKDRLCQYRVFKGSSNEQSNAACLDLSLDKGLVRQRLEILTDVQMGVRPNLSH